LRLYTLQINLKLGDVEANLEKIFSYIEKVEQNSFLLLPEMFSSGFDNLNLSTHCEKTEDIYIKLYEISRRKNITIGGTLPEKRKKGIYNTAFLIDKGEIIYKRDKVKLFTPTGEDKFFKKGKPLYDIAESSTGNLGFLICFELRFCNIAYLLRKKGVEILAVPAQWGKERKEHLTILSKARAIETQSFLVVSNTVGKIGDIEYAGYSGIYSPWGEELVSAKEEEGLFFADIDLEEIYKVRNKIKMEL